MQRPKAFIQQPAADKGRWLAGSHGKKGAGIQLGLPNPDALIDMALDGSAGSDGSSPWESPPEACCTCQRFHLLRHSLSHRLRLGSMDPGLPRRGLQLLRPARCP